jgi:hypothetical protein
LIARRFTVYCAVCVAGAAYSGSSRAVAPRLEVAEGSACAPDPALLDRRISDALIGAPDPDLHVELSITDGSQITARITLLRGGRSLGSKELRASRCDETLDAVIAVAALALSAPQPPPSDSSSARATAKMERRREPSDAVEYGTAAPHAERVDAAAAPPGAARWRGLAGVGADHGSLAEPTVVVRIGTDMALGPGELRAFLWYGVPSIREEIGPALERTRSDFGSMALDYCLHLTDSGWLAACGGLEARARRFARLQLGANQERSEAERTSATLAAATGLVVSYRGAFAQPALDVSTLVPVAGGSQGEGPFGFRAVLGAALPF